METKPKEEGGLLDMRSLSIVFCALLVGSLLSFAEAAVAGPAEDAAKEAAAAAAAAAAGRQNIPRSRDLQKAPDLDSDTGIKSAPAIPAPPARRRSPKGGEKFVLKSIEIEGTEIYNTRDLYPVFRFYIGKKITVDELERIIDRINTFYRQNGWLAAQAMLPPQTISDGNVRVRVFEGRIADIILLGDAGLSKSFIIRELNTLKTGKPARLDELEEAILRLQSFAHVRLVPSLRPSKRQVGGIDLVVEVKGVKPYSGQFLISNSSNEQLGSWAASLITDVHFAQNTLSFYLNSSILKPERSFLGRLSYRHALDYNGSVLGAYVVGNQSKLVTSDGAPLDDKSYGFGIYYKLSGYRSPKFNLDFRLAYDWSRHLTLGGTETRSKGDSNVLALGFSGGYRSPWASYTSFEFNVKQGLTEGGGPDNGSPRIRNGIVNFNRRATWFTANISHTQPLRIQEGYKPSLAVHVSAQGQYSLNPLLNSETIAFGRSNIGRGFPGGRISGDHGWGASAEARISWAHIGIFDKRSLIQNFTLFGFVDAAQTFYADRKKKGVDLEASRRLLSAGAGARMRWADQFYINFYWARALNNPFQKRIVRPSFIITGRPPADGVDKTDKGSDEFIMRLHYLF